MTPSKFAATEALVAAVRNIAADIEAGAGPDHSGLSPTKLALLEALDAYDAAVVAERKAMQETTRRLNEHLAKTLGWRSPNYRYWELGGVRFCYNTTPTNEDGGKWFAWEYRPVRGKTDQLEMAHKVKCGTRTKAKAKAYEWYLKSKEASK